MKDSHTDTASDIATEKYQGPSARVAAAGQGFLEHFFFAATGLISATALAFIFHKPAAKIVQSARDLGTRLKGWTPPNNGIIGRSSDTLSNWAGSALHVAFGDVEAAESLASLASDPRHNHAEWLANIVHDKRQGFGNMFLSHTVGALPWVGMRFKEALRGLGERSSTAIAFGGAAGVLGYIGGWVKALFQGAKHGNKGKHQFERAQGEIKHLRDENSDLKRINEEIRTKYVEAASSIGRDEQPAAPSADISADAAPATTLSNVAHLGTVAKAPELAAAH
jgi:hypothetical protein